MLWRSDSKWIYFSSQIDVDGDSDTVDLSSYFTSSNPISSYSVYVANQSLVNASVSGDTLTFSQMQLEDLNVIVSATDGLWIMYTSQSISVTVNAPNQAFICGLAAFWRQHHTSWCHYKAKLYCRCWNNQIYFWRISDHKLSCKHYRIK